MVRGSPTTGTGCSKRKGGKKCSRRSLRARVGSCSGRRGRPVLQEPVLAAADGEHRNCPGFRGVLLEIPKTSMSASRRHPDHPAALSTDVADASEIDSIIQYDARPRPRPVNWR